MDILIRSPPRPPPACPLEVSGFFRFGFVLLRALRARAVDAGRRMACMARWVLVVGALGLLPVGAHAGEPPKERPPFFGHIANTKENSALSMDCEGDPFG